MDELNKVLGGRAAGGSNDIVGALSGLVGGEGGLQNLVGQLSSNGLGEQISSWVSTGPNKTVDPVQLQQALGEEQVNKLASQSGVPVGQLMPLVAAALPSIVDALTPDGKVPSGNASSGFDIGGLLGGLGAAANAGPGSPLGQLGNLLDGHKG